MLSLQSLGTLAWLGQQLQPWVPAVGQWQEQLHILSRGIWPKPVLVFHERWKLAPRHWLAGIVSSYLLYQKRLLRPQMFKEESAMYLLVYRPLFGANQACSSLKQNDCWAGRCYQNYCSGRCVLGDLKFWGLFFKNVLISYSLLPLLLKLDYIVHSTLIQMIPSIELFLLQMWLSNL